MVYKQSSKDDADFFILFSFPGAYEVCVQQMDDIEIKYIMHDSLGYVMVEI